MHWTVHVDGGSPRIHHASAAVGRFVYTFGGYTRGSENIRISNERPMNVYVFDTINCQSVPLPLPEDGDEQFEIAPRQRLGHTAVTYAECIYIWGGVGQDIVDASILYCFDTNSRKWSQPKTTGVVPEGRDGHIACVIDRRMYIFGGLSVSTGNPVGDLFLDLRHMDWQQHSASGPRPSFFASDSVTVVGPRVFVFGQLESSDHYFDLVCMDTTTQTWRRVPYTGRAPVGKLAFQHGGHIYAFGWPEDPNDVHRFCLEKSAWLAMHVSGHGPPPRSWPSHVVVRDKVFFFGGGKDVTNDDSGHPTSVKEHFEFRSIWEHYGSVDVLDLNPSLQTLCMLVVSKYKLDIKSLPRHIQQELSLLGT